jgi:CHAD domain-containing protein
VAAGAGRSRPARIALAPHDGVRDAARAVIGFHRNALIRAQADAEAGDIEGVHQLRVAIRRLRTALRLFRRALYAAQADKLRRELAAVASAAGRVREADVIGALLKKRVRKLEPEAARELDPMFAEIARRRAEGTRELAAALHSRRYAAALAQLGNPSFRRGRDAALGPIAAELMRPLLRALIRGGSRISNTAPPQAIHRLRIRGKRVRYALEMLGGLGGKKLDKTLRRLAELQDALGEHNDATIALNWVRECSEPLKARPEAMLAAGALSQLVRERERKLRRRGLRAWRKLARSGLLEDAISEVRRNAKVWQSEQTRTGEALP